MQLASISPGVPASDSAMARYVAARFTLAERSGAPVRLAWCGVHSAGEVLFICLRATAAGPLAGATLRNAVLMEKFDDQVNIVQTTVAAGARRTTLFTRGSETKRLP